MNDKELQLLKMIIEKFEWETMFLSSIEIDHPYYRAVVTWGKERPKDVIPYLLAHLDCNWHWAIALEEIVGKENAPKIPEEDSGRGDRITELWLEWGLTHGYLHLGPGES